MEQLVLSFKRQPSPVKFLFVIILTLYQDNCSFSALQLFVIIDQTPIMTADQPLFALANEIQWAIPGFLGEDKLLIMMDALHIEMTFIKC